MLALASGDPTCRTVGNPARAGGERLVGSPLARKVGEPTPTVSAAHPNQPARVGSGKYRLARGRSGRRNANRPSVRRPLQPAAAG